MRDVKNNQEPGRRCTLSKLRTNMFALKISKNFSQHLTVCQIETRVPKRSRNAKDTLLKSMILSNNLHNNLD